MCDKKEKTSPATPVTDEQDKKAPAAALEDEQLDAVTGGDGQPNIIDIFNIINRQFGQNSPNPDFPNQGDNSGETFSLGGTTHLHARDGHPEIPTTTTPTQTGKYTPT